jgi:hypothetical protein
LGVISTTVRIDVKDLIICPTFPYSKVSYKEENKPESESKDAFASRTYEVGSTKKSKAKREATCPEYGGQNIRYGVKSRF